MLRWISIEKEDNGNYSVAYIESFDEGNEDFIDICEFSNLDPDEPFGIVNIFATQDQAVTFSINEYGAKKDCFINAGMIQEEYLSYLKNKF